MTSRSCSLKSSAAFARKEGKIMGRLRGKIAILAAFGLLAAACGGASASKGGGGGQALSITSPSNGAKVKVPFTVQMSTSASLGAPQTGKNHIHLYFDNNSSQYKIVYSTSYRVTSLSA